ncbi:MAG: hypothetical protein DI533_10565 [Cereibacter sphaeroides]|uniref:Uncharacterized protein n=1 Tax=Cereibacter sphaeroides TaxID=1063 RepID=A0A2W5SCB5_CERSP|nr:MAG: hypothetical protein DI533_10565 [Cereibacter sphaeroides]
MKAALIALALAMPGAASAQTVRAQAGEHPGFTRLVLDFPEAASWKLGRTANGYELQVNGAKPRYDLTSVFRVIPRTRLASIWADPISGNLQIGVGCACHAAVFEHRPDILVIDLRDGPSEKGSAAEAALDGAEMPALVAANPPTLRPRRAPGRSPLEDAPQLALFRPPSNPTRRQDEASADSSGAADLRMLLAKPEPPPRLALPFPLPDEPESPMPLDAMRTELLEGMAKAATAGVIDLDASGLPAANTGAPLDSGSAAAHLAIDAVPGIAARPVNSVRPDLTGSGEACLPAEALDIGNWADARPFDQQMAQARDRLVGEFDRPDPERVANLVRLSLYFGFGAEARNLLTSFPLSDQSAPLWATISYIVDAERAPSAGFLADQISCDGPSALWAVLNSADPAELRRANKAAVSAAFSALPVHLRRHLGPDLAEGFLAIGDMATAQSIHDAIWRAPGDPGPPARLTVAQLATARGNLPEAAVTLESVSRERGPAAVRALVDLVDTRIALDQIVDQATITAIAALSQENRGLPVEVDLLRAEILARGSAGDFATAFSMVGRIPPAAPDLWRLLAKSGSDSAILAQAIIPDSQQVPVVDPAIRSLIGERLLRLGFADDALRWLPESGESADMVQLSRAELLRGDARAALRTLAGETGGEADQLRARALAQLGDESAAADALDRAGDAEGASLAHWQALDWKAAAEGAPLWRLAALRALSPEAPLPSASEAAPLSDGRALIEDSTKARAAIAALLESRQAP